MLYKVIHGTFSLHILPFFRPKTLRNHGIFQDFKTALPATVYLSVSPDCKMCVRVTNTGGVHKKKGQNIDIVLYFGTRSCYFCEKYAMEDIFAPLDEEITSFERYFSENNRCILSAPFGEGKSYFLNEFIKSQIEEYDFITIYPTNYQICDNRDVLEYIKRDILFGLIALDDTLINSFNSTKLGILKKAILESKEGIAECIPDINASVCGMDFTFSPGKVINTLSKIWESCEKLSDVDGNPYKEYLLSFDNEKGGIYELDAVTNLICSLVQTRQESGRKMVLVVEDLDRIDPGHIFRILNVLSAHMTYSNGYDDGTKNKFNFDKILLLCDFANIEKIYYHLYGEKTDFKGYISKFSAISPYKFSIRNKIAKHIGCVINEYVKDSVVSYVLAESIVASTRTTANVLIENIRNIKEQIRFASKQYIVTKLSVDVKKDHLTFTGLAEQAKEALDKLYVDTNKPLMAFLSICKAFSLSGKNILDKVAELPRQYYETNHIIELCGILMIPLISNLQPVLDYDLKYRLGTSRGCELKLSDDGEILELIKKPYVHENVLEHISLDVLLGKISELDQYLY